MQPSMASAHYHVARCREIAGDDARAVEHYRRVLDLDPDHDDAREALDRLTAVFQ